MGVYKVVEKAKYKEVGLANTNMGGSSAGYFFTVWAWPVVADNTDEGEYKESKDLSLAYQFRFEPKKQTSYMSRSWADTKAFYAMACFRGNICYNEVMEWKDKYGEGRFEYVRPSDGATMTLYQVDQLSLDDFAQHFLFSQF